ncbi:MAG: hypothetical protein H6622_11830 [Halobacteriovoraceae bacterium]|nr:hypothetical protein [Halobacteriovoraceae bacterium]
MFRKIFILILIPQLLFASSPKCEFFLTKINSNKFSENEVKELFKHYKLDKNTKIYLWILSKKVNKLLNDLQKYNGDKSSAFESSLHEIHETKQRIIALMFIIFIMVLSAYSGQYLLDNLPDNLKFLSTIVTQISIFGVIIFGAPIWERLAPKYRQLSFALEGLQNIKKKGPLYDHLGRSWNITQKIETTNDQISKNIFYQYRKVLKDNLQSMSIAINDNQMDKALNLLSEAIVLLIEDFLAIPKLHLRLKQTVHPYLHYLTQEQKNYFINHLEKSLQYYAHDQETVESALQIYKFWTQK